MSIHHSEWPHAYSVCGHLVEDEEEALEDLLNSWGYPDGLDDLADHEPAVGCEGVRVCGICEVLYINAEDIATFLVESRGGFQDDHVGRDVIELLTDAFKPAVAKLKRDHAAGWWVGSGEHIHWTAAEVRAERAKDEQS
jgi:hypothetical protein